MTKLIVDIRNFANAPENCSRPCMGHHGEVCYSRTDVGVFGRTLDRIFNSTSAILNTGVFLVLLNPFKQMWK